MPEYICGSKQLRDHLRNRVEKPIIGNSPRLFLINPDGSGIRIARDFEIVGEFNENLINEVHMGAAPETISLSRSIPVSIDKQRAKIILYEIVI